MGRVSRGNCVLWKTMSLAISGDRGPMSRSQGGQRGCRVKVLDSNNMYTICGHCEEVVGKFVDRFTDRQIDRRTDRQTESVY